MVEIKLPLWQKSITAVIPDENFVGLFESKAENYHNPLSEQETVENQWITQLVAKIEELAKGKRYRVNQFWPYTSSSFGHIITPIILRRIRSVKPVTLIRIWLRLVSPPFNSRRAINKYGQEIVDNRRNRNAHFLTTKTWLKSGQLLFRWWLHHQPSLLLKQTY